MSGVQNHPASVAARFVSKPDHDLGPCCEVDDCRSLADAVYRSGPALCDEHALEWLNEERTQLTAEVGVWKRNSESLAKLNRDLELARTRFILQRDEALDVLENIVGAADLPGDHCELADAIVQARNLVASYPCGGTHV